MQAQQTIREHGERLLHDVFAQRAAHGRIDQRDRIDAAQHGALADADFIDARDEHVVALGARAQRDQALRERAAEAARAHRDRQPLFELHERVDRARGLEQAQRAGLLVIEQRDQEVRERRSAQAASRGQRAVAIGRRYGSHGSRFAQTEVSILRELAIVPLRERTHLIF